MADNYKVYENEGKKQRRSVITYLEVSKIPSEQPSQPKIPLSDISIVQCHDITVSFYRYLYNTVGELWMWKDRRSMTDEKLLNSLRKEGVGVWVLYVRGCPAGYFELDFSAPPNVELVYFGLIPEYFGLNLGTWFLNEIIKQALQRPGFDRLWVHTCCLDHPKAMDVYKSQGFTPYGEEVVMEDIPDWYLPILERALDKQKAKAGTQ